MESIRVKKLDPKATLPTYGTPEAAGADLYACLDEAVTIEPGKTAWIGTGIDTELLKKLFGGLLILTGLREIFYKPKP